MTDDHMGKAFIWRGLDKLFSDLPPGFAGDVIHIRSLMAESSLFTKEDIETFRWHGSKATFTSLMQHLGVSDKAVRHAGAWSLKADATPDTYLREAAILALKGQEVCLRHLRSGQM